MDCWLTNNCNYGACEKSFCLKRYKLDYLYKKSLLSFDKRTSCSLYPDRDGTDLDEFRKLCAIKENIITFVEKGNNLYLYSTNCGNGKTSWSIKLLSSYLEQIWETSALKCRALFVSVPKFLQALKDNITVKSEYIETIKSCIESADLVIFDDIGSKPGSAFDCEYLLSIIDTRISMGKSNIYTANLNYDALRVSLGDRLASRIFNYSECVELHGADKRNYKKG